MSRLVAAVLVATAGCRAPRAPGPTFPPDPGELVVARFVASAVDTSKPAPETPLPTNYDYSERPQERAYAAVDFGSVPPNGLDDKTLQVARHAFTAAARGDCRKVAGSLQLLAELDAGYHAQVIAMPAFDACLRRR